MIIKDLLHYLDITVDKDPNWNCDLDVHVAIARVGQLMHNVKMENIEEQSMHEKRKMDEESERIDNEIELENVNGINR